MKGIYEMQGPWWINLKLCRMFLTVPLLMSRFVVGIMFSRRLTLTVSQHGANVGRRESVDHHFPRNGYHPPMPRVLGIDMEKTHTQKAIPSAA